MRCEAKTQGQMYLAVRFSCWATLSNQYEKTHWIAKRTTTSHVLQSKASHLSNIIDIPATTKHFSWKKAVKPTNIVASW